MRRAPLERQRRRSLEVKPDGHVRGLGCGHYELFGIAAGRRDGGHPVADQEPRGLGTHLDHHPNPLAARNEGQGHRVDTASLVELDEVDPGRQGLNSQVARAERRHRYLGELQHLRPARLGDDDRAHRLPRYKGKSLVRELADADRAHLAPVPRTLHSTEGNLSGLGSDDVDMRHANLEP